MKWYGHSKINLENAADTKMTTLTEEYPLHRNNKKILQKILHYHNNNTSKNTAIYKEAIKLQRKICEY